MSFNYEEAIRFQKKKKKKKIETNKKLLIQARHDFKNIIQFIIKKYKPLKIYQWGSLISGKHFSEISDIDIGIEGVTSAEDFFQLYKEVEKMTKFPIDIVQLEKIEPEFRDIIILKGIVVYER